MIGIVVATHGHLATGFESAVSLLAGKPENYASVELLPGDEPGAFKNRLEAAVAEVEDGDGVVVLVDLFGGTPSNTVCQLLNHENIRAIAGANLPMIITAAFSRMSTSNLDELVEEIIKAGSEALINVREKLAALQQEDDEDDF